MTPLLKDCGKCGAPITGGNVYWHNPGKGRPVRAACRKCKYARNKRHRQGSKFRVGNATVSYNSSWGDIMAVTSANAKNAPWNLYKVKAEAQDSWQEFQVALDATRTPCFNNEAYTEFTDPRYSDEENAGLAPMPTAAEAEAMCAACPLAAMCKGFAEREKPDWGVYAGTVWIGGKVRKQTVNGKD